MLLKQWKRILKRDDMDKIISWFIIMFIGLVPLGAFFDTKQQPKPNMEQFFMKREKRATNSSQCGDSCELEFVSIKNTFFNVESFGSAGRITFYGWKCSFSRWYVWKKLFNRKSKY
ncbi:hypothetical protein [Spiroplasma endosymbiont of Clivina fossor]|uniref:hypothetical protein n=1 Tax=Spiroplasma endosymbiont of Clivina fossor TaxID=3066282 RepID=UPI00313B7D71